MAQQNPITGSFGAVAAADAAGVHVAGLNKSFGANHVLRGIDLEVARPARASPPSCAA